jgi:hypothetical protein
MAGMNLDGTGLISMDNNARYLKLRGDASTAAKWRTGLAIGAAATAIGGGTFFFLSLPSRSSPSAGAGVSVAMGGTF